LIWIRGSHSEGSFDESGLSGRGKIRCKWLMLWLAPLNDDTTSFGL